MLYLKRAVKYFIWFTLILCVTMAVLALLNIVDPDPDKMFRDGMKSIAQIAVLFGVVAAIYPKFGFTRRDVTVPEDRVPDKTLITRTMESRGFRLENDGEQRMTFRLRSKTGAFFKMFEDRITIDISSGSCSVEGLTKEVVRVVGALELAFNPSNEY